MMRHGSLALAAQVILMCVTYCQSARQFRHSWSYDDMVSGCKPWMSVQVKIGNDTKLLNVSFELSTGFLIMQQLHVHTGRRIFTARNRMPCLYHSAAQKLFASAVRGMLKMTFKHNDEWYSVEKLQSSSEPAVAQKLQPEKNSIAGTCIDAIPPNEINELKLNGSFPEYSTVPLSPVRNKRALKLPGSASKKVLELAVVLDRSFVNKARSEGSAVARVMEITNVANGLYERLGLQIVLTNILIWPSDPFHVSTNPTDNLNSFTLYKIKQINFQYDTVALMSGTRWGSVLGLAWIKGLCQRQFSSLIVSDAYAQSLSAGLTLTHEIGHNLGFSHVEEVPGCTCNRTGACVMSTYMNLEIPNWDSCAVDAWNSQVNAAWRSCLADAPEASYYSSRSAMCGNGIIESGEQCDCGPVQICTSKCCNATTCQLNAGAVCASGACCNQTSCTFRARGVECRAATGPCDVAETCNGSEEWCPSDDKVADGVDCASGQAYCYNGQCKTRNAQCQSLFSNFNASEAPRLCSVAFNTRGTSFGHCDKRLLSVAESSTLVNITYSYTACSASNVECGLLHCSMSALPLSYSKMTLGNVNCYSQPSLDSSSSGMRSASLVADGAMCSTNSMCINSTCIPLASVRNCSDCPNCNGNGFLTKAKLCFCNSGYAPPNCVTSGCGGSVTSPVNCPSEFASSVTVGILSSNRPSNLLVYIIPRSCNHPSNQEFKIAHRKRCKQFVEVKLACRDSSDSSDCSWDWAALKL